MCRGKDTHRVCVCPYLWLETQKKIYRYPIFIILKYILFSCYVSLIFEGILTQSQKIVMSTSVLGHLIQRTDSLEKTLMLGKTEGRKRRGWQRMRWLDDITDLMDMSLSKLWNWWCTGKSSRGSKSQTWLSDWTELNWTSVLGSCRKTTKTKYVSMLKVSCTSPNNNGRIKNSKTNLRHSGGLFSSSRVLLTFSIANKKINLFH